MAGRHQGLLVTAGAAAAGKAGDMRRQVTGALAAVITLCLAAAGCGGGRHDSARVTAAACPAAMPAVTAPAGAGDGSLVPPGPAVVSLCQYSRGLAKSKARGAPLRRIVLHGQGAAGLAAIIDGAGPVTAHARRCARSASLLPLSQLLIFSYSTAPRSAVSVAYTACSLAVLTTPERSGVLSGQIENDLFYYTTATRHARGPRAPGLLGLTARGALAAARQHRFGASIDGAVIDRLARSGTVIFQSPLAGMRDSGAGPQVSVILAVHAAPACTTHQLALTYLDGGPGAGNDLATLLIRDTSGSACTMTGPLQITGLDAHGRPDTNAIRLGIVGAAVVSPHAGAISRPANSAAALVGVHPGELTGQVELIAEYRDGPPTVNHGLCQPLWVIPATWRVTLPGATLSVANRDPAGQDKLVPSGGLVTCRGRLGGYGPATVVSPGP